MERLAKPAGAACLKCPARDGKLLAPQPVRPGIKLVVIGEAPWRGEFDSGEIGSNERMLKAGLRTVGLAPHEVHWTNAVLCACPQKEQKKAAKACSARLRQEVARAAPLLAVPVGSLGLASVMGRASASHAKWRGSITPSEAPELSGIHSVLVAPIVQPLLARRVERWKPVFESDLRRLGRILRAGQFIPPELQAGRELVIARSLEQLDSALDRLGPEVSGDVETVGLGPTTVPLTCLGFSDGPSTVVLPWSQSNNGRDPYWLNPDLVASKLTAMLASRTLITQNGPAFDHVVLARYGVHWKKWDDTMMAQHAMRSDLPKGLAFLATTYLDVSAWKQFEDRGADLERLMVYNGRDCLYTILVWQEQKRRLEQA